MSSSIEILKQRKTKLTAEFEKLIPNCTLPVNSQRLNSIETEMNQINREIEQIHASNRFNSSYLSMKESADLKRFSFAKFLKESLTRTLTGFEAEMADLGKSERLAMGGTSPGGFCIPQRVLNASRETNNKNIGSLMDISNITTNSDKSYFERLSFALGLPAVGATFLTEISGMETAFLGGEFSSYWMDKEETRIKVYNAKFDDVLMHPNPLISISIFKNNTINRITPAAEMWIMNNLITANAYALLLAAINGLLANSQIVGLLNTPDISSVIGGENGMVPTWKNIVKLEEAVLSHTYDNGVIAYLTNPFVQSTLKQTQKVAGTSGYIWEGSTFLNGKNTVVSNAIPSNLTKGTAEGICSAIICGKFSDMIIGMWGGLDVLVDPFSLGDRSQTRVVTNSFTDIAITNPKSFAAMTDALTI